MSLRLQFSDNLFNYFLENIYFVLLEWAEVDHVLPPPGAQRIEESRMCPRCSSRLCVVPLYLQDSDSSWTHRALLASCVLWQDQNLPCAALERCLGLSLQDCESDLWPGKGLFTGTFYLPTASSLVLLATLDLREVPPCFTP